MEHHGGSPFLNKRILEIAYWGMNPIARAMISLKVHPNLLSAASLFFGTGAGTLLALGHFGIGGGLAAIAGLLDAFDGMVARLSKMETKSGGILDTTLDRYVEFFLLCGLCVYYRAVLPVMLLALFALMGSFMVSYSSSLSLIHQISLPKNSMRRAERLLFLVFGAIVSSLSIYFWEGSGSHAIPIGYPMVMALGIVAGLANYSAIERIIFLMRAVNERESANVSKRRTVG